MLAGEPVYDYEICRFYQSEERCVIRQSKIWFFFYKQRVIREILKLRQCCQLKATLSKHNLQIFLRLTQSNLIVATSSAKPFALFHRSMVSSWARDVFRKDICSLEDHRTHSWMKLWGQIVPKSDCNWQSLLICGIKGAARDNRKGFCGNFAVRYCPAIILGCLLLLTAVLGKEKFSGLSATRHKLAPVNNTHASMKLGNWKRILVKVGQNVSVCQQNCFRVSRVDCAIKVWIWNWNNGAWEILLGNRFRNTKKYYFCEGWFTTICQVDCSDTSFNEHNVRRFIKNRIYLYCYSS